jgi:putative cardiolipin synthase
MNMDFRSSRLNTELGLAERVRAIGSYRLRLAQPGDRLQWVANDVNGVETVYDSEPGVDFGTQLQLLLLFPFISESLL